MVFKRLLTLSPSLVGIAVATSIQAPRAAWADDPRQPQQQPLQPYDMEPTQPPVYPAPLSQMTQTTYVPQSVALSGPEEIDDYDETRAVPLGYTPVERTRKGLIIGGAVTLGATYTLAALIAAAGEDTKSSGGENKVGALWIPVVGPFVEVGRTDVATAKVFLVSFGAAQAAGAFMLIAGLSSPQHVLVRNDLLGMKFAPMTSAGASGMTVSGSF